MAIGIDGIDSNKLPVTAEVRQPCDAAARCASSATVHCATVSRSSRLDKRESRNLLNIYTDSSQDSEVKIISVSH